MSRFVVHGYDILDEAESIPVEVRCTVCGACAVMGEHGYSADLTRLTDWAQAHECSRELRVT